jgi:hypothetical protein
MEHRAYLVRRRSPTKAELAATAAGAPRQARTAPAARDGVPSHVATPVTEERVKQHPEGAARGDTEGKKADPDLNLSSKARRNAAVVAVAGSTSSSSPRRDNNNNNADAGGAFATRPGAMAVRGRVPASSDDHGEGEDGPSPPVRPRGRDGSQASSSAAGTSSPLVLAEPVAAYAVKKMDADDDDDDDDDENARAAKAMVEADKLERIRSQILSQAAEAVVVPAAPDEDDSQSSKRRRKRRVVVGAVLVVLVIVGVAVGVAVPLTTQQNSNAPPTPAPDVRASFTYNQLSGENGFAHTVNAENKKGSFFGKEADTTTGAARSVNCKVKSCTANGTNCAAGRDYEPGCCLGGSCPGETQCGDACPKPPESCYRTDPDNLTCTRSECYTCNAVDGQDMYELSDVVLNINCIHVGTSIRQSNGQTYKWAILCGPMEGTSSSSSSAQSNVSTQDYRCLAARQGAGYSDESDGILTDTLPCHYIALAECGCGPAGMDTLGLPEPAATCPANGTCPFRCDESGSEGASALCTAFPGNVSWWDGENVLDQAQFVQGLAGTGHDLNIYIQGEGS